MLSDFTADGDPANLSVYIHVQRGWNIQLTVCGVISKTKEILWQ